MLFLLSYAQNAARRAGTHARLYTTEEMCHYLFTRNTAKRCPTRILLNDEEKSRLDGALDEQARRCRARRCQMMRRAKAMLTALAEEDIYCHEEETVHRREKRNAPARVPGKVRMARDLCRAYQREPKKAQATKTDSHTTPRVLGASSMARIRSTFFPPECLFRQATRAFHHLARMCRIAHRPSERKRHSRCSVYRVSSTSVPTKKVMVHAAVAC